jgi:predicted DNA-binding WGR domain protein
MSLTIVPMLFGKWAVLREWGRRGSPGTLRLVTCDHQVEAEAAAQRSIKKRLQHGYQAAGKFLACSPLGKF